MKNAHNNFVSAAFFALCTLGLTQSAQAQALSKCTDGQGKVTYQEGRCGNSAKEASVKVTQAPTAPKASEKAAANKDAPTSSAPPPPSAVPDMGENCREDRSCKNAPPAKPKS